MTLTNDYVVLHRDAWEGLLAALTTGDQTGAAVAALTAPVDGDTYVVRESDPLAAQGLYSYAANLRTAIEFTQQQGLCVMTDETASALATLAEQITMLGCTWQEKQETSGATVQAADWGTLEP